MECLAHSVKTMVTVSLVTTEASSLMRILHIEYSIHSRVPDS